MSGPQPNHEAASALELNSLQLSVMAVAVGLVALYSNFSPHSTSQTGPSQTGPLQAGRSAGGLIEVKSEIGADSPNQFKEDPFFVAVGSTAPIQIDLNTASASELGLLPGIGDKTAMQLIAARTRLGGFRSWQDIEAIPGVGPATVAAMEPWCKSLTGFSREPIVAGAMEMRPRGMPISAPSTNPLATTPLATNPLVRN